MPTDSVGDNFPVTCMSFQKHCLKTEAIDQSVSSLNPIDISPLSYIPNKGYTLSCTHRNEQEPQCSA